MPLNVFSVMSKDTRAAVGKLSKAIGQVRGRDRQQSDPPGLAVQAEVDQAPLVPTELAPAEEVSVMGPLTQDQEDEQMARRLQLELDVEAIRDAEAEQQAAQEAAASEPVADASASRPSSITGLHLRHKMRCVASFQDPSTGPSVPTPTGSEAPLLQVPTASAAAAAAASAPRVAIGAARQWARRVASFEDPAGETDSVATQAVDADDGAAAASEDVAPAVGTAAIAVADDETAATPEPSVAEIVAPLAPKDVAFADGEEVIAPEHIITKDDLPEEVEADELDFGAPVLEAAASVPAAVEGKVSTAELGPEINETSATAPQDDASDDRSGEPEPNIAVDGGAEAAASEVDVADGEDVAALEVAATDGGEATASELDVAAEEGAAVASVSSAALSDTAIASDSPAAHDVEAVGVDVGVAESEEAVQSACEAAAEVGEGAASELDVAGEDRAEAVSGVAATSDDKAVSSESVTTVEDTESVAPAVEVAVAEADSSEFDVAIEDGEAASSTTVVSADHGAIDCEAEGKLEPDAAVEAEVGEEAAAPEVAATPGDEGTEAAAGAAAMAVAAAAACAAAEAAEAGAAAPEPSDTEAEAGAAAEAAETVAAAPVPSAIEAEAGATAEVAEAVAELGAAIEADSASIVVEVDKASQPKSFLLNARSRTDAQSVPDDLVKHNQPDEAQGALIQ